MKNVQQIFTEQQSIKKEMKEIRKEYKDVLAQDVEYIARKEKLEELKELVKQRELSAQRDMGSRWERWEELKGESKSLKEMLSDVSLSNLMDGETVEVRDEFDRLHEPVYNVTFKKIS